MPRITITVSDETLAAMDDFAEHIGKSRSIACSSVLDMVVPMLDYLKTTYDFVKSGDTAGLSELVDSIGELLDETSAQFESVKEDFSGLSEGGNPRSCNNGGQVSPTDLQNPTQPVVFLEKSPLDTPPEDQGGENA
jgi:predicted transcriptional regulator